MFLGRSKYSKLIIPWCTYTDPEIAHVGVYSYQLDAQKEVYRVFCKRLSDVDRSITDGETEGFVKILCKGKTDEIIGASIVAPHAGDMISEITMAMN